MQQKRRWCLSNHCTKTQKIWKYRLNRIKALDKMTYCTSTSPNPSMSATQKKRKKDDRGESDWLFFFLTLCSSKLKHLWGVDKCSCSVPRGICHGKQTTHGYRDIPPKTWRHKTIQSAPAKVFSLIFSIEIYLWKQRDKKKSRKPSFCCPLIRWFY